MKIKRRNTFLSMSNPSCADMQCNWIAHALQHGASCGSPVPPVHSSSFSSSSSPNSCSLPLYSETLTPATRPSPDCPSAVKVASPAPVGTRDSLECKYSSPQSEKEYKGERRMRRDGSLLWWSRRSLDQNVHWLCINKLFHQCARSNFSILYN